MNETPFMTYIATSLNDIAGHFRSLADYHHGTSKTAAFKRDRDAAKIRASVWEEAAMILEQTDLQPPT